MVNVVWFKRDLRLQDHAPLHLALQKRQSVLLLYIFEPILLKDSHYSERHFRFIKESLEELQKQLEAYHTQILIVEGNAEAVFKTIHQQLTIKSVFSHQETGLQITFKRDKSLKILFKSLSIQWKEFVNNGVIRGLENRKTWINLWENFMSQDLVSFSASLGQFADQKSNQ